MCLSDKERTAHVIIVSAELVFGDAVVKPAILVVSAADGLKL